jgi:serine protease Do
LDRSKGKLIRTDCQLIGGDSGGPLVDLHGEVIGIHSRIGSSLANNQHVPIAAYLDHWDQLVSGVELGLVQPWIGVVSKNGFDSATITEIRKGSPADKAGIRVGDTITSFDGKQVRSMSELKELVLTQNPGDEVRITVMRGNKKLGIGVTVGQRGL